VSEPDDALAADLAVRLRDAHRRVRDLDADPEVKARVARRLIALTDASKHDVGRASTRLDRLLADLDAGRLPEEG
jgi:hypothetical protein